MSVIQLSGGSQPAPAGAVFVRLSVQHGVELVFLDADGAPVAPDFPQSRTEAVIIPRGPLTVAARTLDGQPFARGTRIGVSIKPATAVSGGGGDEVVRPPSDVGGRQQVALVELADGRVTDLLGQAAEAERAWMRRGNYAYHVHHRQPSARRTPWAVVIDGSLTGHHRDSDAFRGFLELVLGVAATGFGAAPVQCVVATMPPRDVTPALDGDEIDWDGLLGHAPAPWPSLGGAVEVALGALPQDGAVVLVTDGPFVDYREVRQQLEDRRCLVVTTGRSRFGARPSDRPTHFWEEELDALAGFEVASVADFDGLADEAHALADVMFRGDRG